MSCSTSRSSKALSYALLRVVISPSLAAFPTCCCLKKNLLKYVLFLFFFFMLKSEFLNCCQSNASPTIAHLFLLFGILDEVVRDGLAEEESHPLEHETEGLEGGRGSKMVAKGGAGLREAGEVGLVQ